MNFAIFEKLWKVWESIDCMKKLCIPKRACNENDLLKNGVINKRAAGIKWKCKNLLYLL